MRATQKYREECRLAFLAAKIPPLRTPVTIDLVSYHAGRGTKDGRYRPEDQTNLLGACKPLYDALQDAGVIESDTYDHLRIGRVVLFRRKAEHGGRAGILVTITEAKENQE